MLTYCHLPVNKDIHLAVSFNKVKGLKTPKKENNELFVPRLKEIQLNNLALKKLNCLMAM